MQSEAVNIAKIFTQVKVQLLGQLKLLFKFFTIFKVKNKNNNYF